MIDFLSTLFRLFFQVFKSKSSIMCENALLKKENDILLRKSKKKRFQFNVYDKLFLVALNMAVGIKDRLQIVKPATLLLWQKTILKRLWTFKHPQGIRGRKPVAKDIKALILSMKNENLLWGTKRIQGELLKLDITLDTKTIRNILQSFRKRGKIIRSLTWSKFLKSQMASIYAMDFFTIDTVLHQRFYVLAIISHQTREIVRCAVTDNPVKEFVRQQLLLFTESLKAKAYLIHDNAQVFGLDYSTYNIASIRTSVEAPNMNSIMERFVESVRREALDYFLIISKKQVRTILTEYVNHYNSQRPHQGIGQAIPIPSDRAKNGVIRKMDVLGGLHHHYYREAA